jgi:hypothetical protein
MLVDQRCQTMSSPSSKHASSVTFPAMPQSLTRRSLLVSSNGSRCLFLLSRAAAARIHCSNVTARSARSCQHSSRYPSLASERRPRHPVMITSMPISWSVRSIRRQTGESVRCRYRRRRQPQRYSKGLGCTIRRPRRMRKIWESIY